MSESLGKPLLAMIDDFHKIADDLFERGPEAAQCKTVAPIFIALGRLAREIEQLKGEK